MNDPRAGLSPAALAALVREHLLAGHLIDRAGMPLLLQHVDRDEMAQVAIEEWRAASPVYTRRMQRLLGFDGGDDVATIFKGMQLDIGAPPQFMDFRYQVHDRDHGEFWLDHCGALMDVEPMGDEFVETMCHTIEDPTFPATACATNPRARVEPVHRPPRLSPDQHPHCRWTVTIDPDAEPAAEPAEAVRLAATAAATSPLPALDAGGTGAGRTLYDGPLEQDLDLEAFSPTTLRAIDDEVCLQGHLLALAYQMAVADRLGAGRARELGRAQLAGVGAVVAGRIRATLGLAGGLPGVARVLRLHPALLPGPYVDVRVESDDALVRVALCGGPALAEGPAPSWPMLLADEGGTEILDAIVGGVDPRGRCHPVAGSAPGVAAAWDVVLADEPAPEPPEATLTRFSTGTSFVFVRR